MPKMSTIDLKALLSAERYDALSAMAASKLSDERASALNYSTRSASETPASCTYTAAVAPTSEAIYAEITRRFGARRLSELQEMLAVLEQSLADMEGADGDEGE